MISADYAAQKLLAVDLYRPWGLKRIRFYPNDLLVYKTKGSGLKQRDTLADMRDSTLIFKDGSFVRLDEIKTLYIDRSNFLVRKFRKAFTVAGTGIILIDTFNNLINDDRPFVKERIVVVGTALFVTGQVIKLLETKRVRPGRNRQLKIFDLRLD